MEQGRDATGMALLGKCGSIVSVLERDGEASVAALAATVGEPVSSTYRLLAALSEVGWVNRGSRRGLFRLGVKFVRIGSLLEDQLSVRDASREALQSLRAATGSTTFLCILRDDAAVCVERLAGHEVQSLAMRIGDSLPLFRGAAPLALFAFLPRGEQDAMLTRIAARRDAGDDVPAESTLRRLIRTTRETGHSVSDEDVTPGIAAIGAPVFNHRGELEAAISVSGLRHRILDDALDVAALTISAALDISRALGYEPAEGAGS